ncbi:unnamed protein product [Strongylus vulgaris]|uniref:Uncharacterized protein n=1 Tax=Strongylus vulgaris TaxID=40348 RepID=A0A3P7LF42_STRVU|nr:unnamed protein product [Strongylus vulgaris]
MTAWEGNPGAASTPERAISLTANAGRKQRQWKINGKYRMPWPGPALLKGPGPAATSIADLSTKWEGE